jgi:hypothetical protein
VPFIVAHAGHWLVSLMYLVPVLGLVVMLSIQMWRDKRRARNGHTMGADEPE